MRCEIKTRMPNLDKVDCLKEAVAKITVGCVHEHIRSKLVCESHKIAILDNLNSKDAHKLCTQCCDEFAMLSGLMSGTNHICPVSLCKVEELN